MAQIGFFTTVAEAVAAAVGAGMLLGGFVSGSLGFISGRPKAALDRGMFIGAHLGGLVAILLGAFDLATRYIS